MPRIAKKSMQKKPQAKKVSAAAKKRNTVKNASFNDDDVLIEKMLTGLTNISAQQGALALDLTALVVENTSPENLSEEAIFGIFERASKTVAASFPVKVLLESFNQ